MTRSVRSRREGFDGDSERSPRAVAARALPFCQMISPRSRSRRRSCRMPIDVGRQAAVRLAAEVGDVDRDATARLELARRTRRTRPRASGGTRRTSTACLRRSSSSSYCLPAKYGGEVTTERHRAVRHHRHVPRVADPERIADRRRGGIGVAHGVVLGDRRAPGSGRRTPTRRGSPGGRPRSSTSRWASGRPWPETLRRGSDSSGAILKDPPVAGDGARPQNAVQARWRPLTQVAWRAA